MKSNQLLLLVFALILRWHASAAILPPNPEAVVGGRTVAEWSAEWWKWAYSISTNNHPLFDPDGRWAHLNQPEGSVFFLAGSFGLDIPGPATRFITVAENKSFFFPISNVYAGDPGDPPCGEPRRRAKENYITSWTELHASIDLEPIPDLARHRALSPEFSFEHLTCDNIMTVNNGFCIVGVVDCMCADGYYVVVEPLSLGEHVINFGATYGPPFDFSMDITFFITTVEVPLTDWVNDFLVVVRRTPVPERELSHLLRPLERAHRAFAAGRTKPGMNHLRSFQRVVERRLAPVNSALTADYLVSADRILARATRDLQ